MAYMGPKVCHAEVMQNSVGCLRHIHATCNIPVLKSCSLGANMLQTYQPSLGDLLNAYCIV